MRYTKQTERRPAGVPATCRLPAETLAQVEVVAPLAGMTRSAYIAAAVVERLARDLARLVQRPANHGERTERRATGQATR